MGLLDAVVLGLVVPSAKSVHQQVRVVLQMVIVQRHSFLIFVMASGMDLIVSVKILHVLRRFNVIVVQVYVV
jgi:hypothetical protein